MGIHRAVWHFHMKHRPHEVDEKVREEILNLGIWSLFRKLAVPAIIAMLMYAIYIFVDAIFVGQWVGVDALAAISIAAPLLLINTAIAAFVGMGFGSLLSRAMGARDDATIAPILTSATVSVLVFSALFTLFGYVFGEPLVAFMGGQGTILTLGTSYFVIVIFGSVFFNFVGSSNMLMRAEGRLKAAMVIVTIGSLLNVALDPVFILGFGMGVQGAAVATVIAMVITAVITLAYFLSGTSELSFNREGLRAAPRLLRETAPVGASGLVMQLMTVTAQVAIFRSVGIYGGGTDLAVIGATMNMLAFALIPMWGIAQGLQPLVGMNFGAKQYPRVREGFTKFLWAATAVAVGIWALFMAFADTILSLYITDPALASSGANVFRLVMSVFFIQGLIFLPVVLFQAIGKGGIASFLLLSRQILLFLPIIIVLPLFLGLDGVWVSIPLADALVVGLTVILILREFRDLGTLEAATTPGRAEAV